MAEAQEATTQEKLHLEQQAQRGTIRESYCCLFSVVSPAWAVPAGRFSAEAEDQAAQDRATLETLLGAFEPEGVAVTEGLYERLEASCGRLEAFVKGAAKDAVQHTLGLV